MVKMFSPLQCPNHMLTRHKGGCIATIAKCMKVGQYRPQAYVPVPQKCYSMDLHDATAIGLLSASFSQELAIEGIKMNWATPTLIPNKASPQDAIMQPWAGTPFDDTSMNPQLCKDVITYRKTVNI